MFSVFRLDSQTKLAEDILDRSEMHSFMYKTICVMFHPHKTAPKSSTMN